MKIDGDFKYVRHRVRFGLERFGLERGNCRYFAQIFFPVLTNIW